MFIITGNEISKVEGMEGLHDLRELVLDRNKIKIITELSFANQWNLQELHLEENRVRELTYLNCMDNLQRLYMGSNRVQVIVEINSTACDICMFSNCEKCTDHFTDV